MRILVVEDEEKVASFVQQGLQVSGYTVDVAGTGEDALRLLETGEHDTVVLDMMLPGISGLDVVRELRRQGKDLPVLALTARGELDDRIAGLEAGCDDYLPKPFAFEELLARIKALQRRLGTTRPGSLTYKDLVLDLSTRVATRGGTKIELTNKEYALLEYLMRRPGQVLPRGELLESVWGYDFETPSNVLEVYMNFLRKKVDSKFTRKLLHTVRGVGYVLREEE
ncbi:MAG: winged-helix transcriptional response regulator [Armatimonadetes bacterium]|jgi:DNA-binding response OmpR family regulator|nr:winged-helix transcriptional response regulator [Armatimonadota bacterium]